MLNLKLDSLLDFADGKLNASVVNDVFKYAYQDKYLTYSEFDKNIEKLYYSNKHNK